MDILEQQTKEADMKLLEQYRKELSAFFKAFTYISRSSSL